MKSVFIPLTGKKVFFRASHKSGLKQQKPCMSTKQECTGHTDWLTPGCLFHIWYFRSNLPAVFFTGIRSLFRLWEELPLKSQNPMQTVQKMNLYGLEIGATDANVASTIEITC